LTGTSDDGGTRQEGVDDNGGGFKLKFELTRCLAPIAAAIGAAIEDVEEFDIEIIISETNTSFDITINGYSYSGIDGEL
jgi:hypothetical protein